MHTTIYTHTMHTHTHIITGCVNPGRQFYINTLQVNYLHGVDNKFTDTVYINCINFT